MKKIAIILNDLKIYFDTEFNSKEYPQKSWSEVCKKYITKRSGLYFLFNKADDLIYIGWACYLPNRLNGHVTGNSNTSFFSKEVHMIRIIYSESFDKFREKHPACNDIEFYLIDKLKPEYNKRWSKRLSQNENHPFRDSQIKVEPIKDLKAIKKIKKRLSNKPMDFALFVIGINTNLRVGDILRLKVGQVKDSNKIEIKNKRQKKPRRVTLNKACINAIQSVLDTKKLNDDDYLFTGQRGVWTISYVNAKVKKWCKELDLRGNYGGHTLRKTWGYHQRVTFKMDLPVLMKCFNHSNQKQTLDYLCIQEQEIEDVFQNEL